MQDALLTLRREGNNSTDGAKRVFERGFIKFFAEVRLEFDVDGQGLTRTDLREGAQDPRGQRSLDLHRVQSNRARRDDFDFIFVCGVVCHREAIIPGFCGIYT